MDQLTEFNSGQTHEENKYGGIPQGISPNGQPNLVEEGETKLNSKNYIFSDRIIVNKNLAEDFNLPKSSIGKSFADVSKKFNLPHSRRENDPIEEVDKRKNLDKLMDAQEAFKRKEFEEAMAIVQSYQPAALPPQDMSQNIGQAPMEMPLEMSNGGNMYYDFGGFMQGTGNVLSTAAPWLSKIPGVGNIAGAAVGALGAGLQNVDTNASTGEVIKDSLFGAIKGGIPGSSFIINGLESKLDPNQPNQFGLGGRASQRDSNGNVSYPDGGKMETKENPYYKQQSALLKKWNNPQSFISQDHRVLEGAELDQWYNQAIKNNPGELEENGNFVGGFKPKQVYLSNTSDSYYPVYNTPEKVITVPPAPTSDIPVPVVKPTDQTATEVVQPNLANRNQTYYTQDAQGNWSTPNSRSVPYYNMDTRTSLNTPNIVWIDNQGQQLTSDPRKMAEGGSLGNPPFIDPAVWNYIYSQNQVPNLQQMTQTPDYQQSQDILGEPEDIEEIGARLLQEDDPTIVDDNDIADQPTLPENMTEEEYQSLLQSEQENLDNNIQDLRVNQSLPNAIAQGLPVAYNIGMGLFGKASQLDPNNYLNNTNINAPEYNIDPQLREAEQTFATAQNSLANAAPSGGAYMTNLQQLANMRNKQIGGIHAAKENIDNQNQFTADQFNASMQANNNNTRFQIEDYNARAKGAKQAMLAEGLNQAANIAASGTANNLATSYYTMGAPDFAGQVGYNSYWEQLKNKRNNQGT